MFHQASITSHYIQESYGLYYHTYYVNRKYIINQILIENNVLLMKGIATNEENCDWSQICIY